MQVFRLPPLRGGCGNLVLRVWPYYQTLLSIISCSLYCDLHYAVDVWKLCFMHKTMTRPLHKQKNLTTATPTQLQCKKMLCMFPFRFAPALSPGSPGRQNGPDRDWDGSGRHRDTSEQPLPSDGVRQPGSNGGGTTADASRARGGTTDSLLLVTSFCTLASAACLHCLL